MTVWSSSIVSLNSSDTVWIESRTCVEALTMKPLGCCEIDAAAVMVKVNFGILDEFYRYATTFSLSERRVC